MIQTFIRSVVCLSVCLSVCLCVDDDREPCKNGLTDRDVVGGAAPVGPRKGALDGVYVGFTWQIRLNEPCSVAMLAVAVVTIATCH